MRGTSVPAAVILLGALCSLLPAAAAAQETTPPPAPPQRPDTSALVFDREVFTYPRLQRRVPFAPLLSGDATGPRYEEIRLIGVIFNPNPDLSLALFGPRSGGGEQGGAARSFSVRRGDRLGNVRILEIQLTRVVVEVEEFGLTEQRIMELQRPGQGGLS